MKARKNTDGHADQTANRRRLPEASYWMELDGTKPGLTPSSKVSVPLLFPNGRRGEPCLMKFQDVKNQNRCGASKNGAGLDVAPC